MRRSRLGFGGPWGVDVRVSAVVPALNEEARIGTLLDDLRAACADEILVVDGGSADATVRIAASKSGVRVLHAARGRGVQLNEGARHATGDVLWFVHADVRVPPSAKASIARALSDPGVVAGAFRIRTLSEGRRHWAVPLLPLADLRSRFTRRPYGDQAMFVRARVFRDLGGFAPIRLLEDLELASRLGGLGRVVVVPEQVEVSGRRFLARPFTMVLVMNAWPLLFRLGVHPDVLDRWYGHPR